MKKVAVILFTLLMVNAYSQEKKFSIEASYPDALGENFLGRSYSGIFDLGLKYRFTDLEKFNVGVSINGNFFKIPDDKAIPGVKVTLFNIQPRLFLELDSESIKKFHPSIGLGYSILNYKAKGTNLDESDPSSSGPINFSNSNGAININLGLVYDMTEDLFIQAQYDYLKVTVDKGVPKSTFNTNGHILKFGLGYRF